MSRVVHFEIPSDNPDNARKFYGEVFGWTFSQLGNEAYWLVKTGDESIPGINGAIMKKNHPQQPITNNIEVVKIDDAIRKVESAGGKVVVPKTAIHGTGWFAYFMDTDNNIFGLWQSDRDAS